MKTGDKVTLKEIYFQKSVRLPGTTNAPLGEYILRPTSVIVGEHGLDVGNRFYPWNMILFATYPDPAKPAPPPSAAGPVEKKK